MALDTKTHCNASHSSAELCAKDSTRHASVPAFRSGFTLVELLVSMALLSIITLVVSDVLITALDLRSQGESVSAVQMDAQYIVAKLQRDIGLASGISSPSALGASGATLVATIGGVIHTYSLSNGALILATPGGSMQLHSSESTVTELAFTRVGNATISGSKELIQLRATLASVTADNGTRKTASISTTFGRR